MEDRPVYSYIPKNLNYAGGLFGGMLDPRHLIEGCIGAGLAMVLYKIANSLIHTNSDTLLYVFAVLALLLFGAGLVGGNGEPLSIFLFNFINYENRRIYVTLRPPMPEFEKKAKKAQFDTNEKKSLSERLIKMKSGEKASPKEPKVKEKKKRASLKDKLSLLKKNGNDKEDTP